MDWEGVRLWLEDWAAGAEWGVAAGTALLALATFVVAARAKAEATAIRKQAQACFWCQVLHPSDSQAYRSSAVAICKT
jgi:hypothetical protein